jgi:hypothetical protein
VDRPGAGEAAALLSTSRRQAFANVLALATIYVYEFGKHVVILLLTSSRSCVLFILVV